MKEGFQEERYVAAYECGINLLISSMEAFKPPSPSPEGEGTKKKGKKNNDVVDVEFLKKHFDDSRRRMFEESRTWFLRAFEHSDRAEPLLALAKYYAEKKDWRNAYFYSSMACKVSEPKDALLWYNSKVYTYDRWHIHSLIAYNMKFVQEATDACQKAIDAEQQECDIKNMLFFQQELNK
jgi:hypothetical protein